MIDAAILRRERQILTQVAGWPLDDVDEFLNRAARAAKEVTAQKNIAHSPDTGGRASTRMAPANSPTAA